MNTASYAGIPGTSTYLRDIPGKNGMVGSYAMCAQGICSTELYSYYNIIPSLILCKAIPIRLYFHRGSTADMVTQNITDVQIPALKDLCSTGSLSIDNIDVFCEKGVFDTDTSRRILR